MLKYMPQALLLYATNSGNTEFAAQTIANALASNHIQIDILNVAEAKPEDVIGYNLLILGSPTWDNVINGRYKQGQLQDQMAAFLHTISQVDLAKQPMAVFGLGDSNYQYFCGSAILLQKFVSKAGAHLISDPLYIDGYPQFQAGLLVDWAAQVGRSWHEYQLLNQTS